MRFLFPNVPPDFVALDILHRDVDDQPAHELFAAVASENQRLHDRVPVHPAKLLLAMQLLIEGNSIRSTMRIKLPMESHDDSIGDAYCFVAIERYSKLVLNFALGRRSQAT